MCQCNPNCGGGCGGSCCTSTKSDQIKYSGPNLSCLNINLYDDLTTIIQILTTAVCANTTTSTSSTSTSTSTTTSTTTVQNCFIWEAVLTANGSNQPPTVQVINSTFGEAMVVSAYDAETTTLVIHLLGAIPNMDETTMILLGNNSAKVFAASVNTITFESLIESTGIIVKHCNTLPNIPVSYGYLFLGPASGPDPCLILFPPIPFLLYSTKPNSADLVVGDILYQDQELSIPYTGAGSNYIMQYSTNIAYTLNNAGAIDTVTLC